MGGSASLQKAAVKYRQASLQNGPKKQYDHTQLEGAGPATFETAKSEEELKSEADRKLNTRSSSYRSKEPSNMESSMDSTETVVRQVSHASFRSTSNSRATAEDRRSPSNAHVGVELNGKAQSLLKPEASHRETRSRSHPPSSHFQTETEHSSIKKSLLVPEPFGGLERSGSKRTTVGGDGRPQRLGSKSSNTASTGALPAISQKASKDRPALEIVEARGNAMMDLDAIIEGKTHPADMGRSDRRARTTLHQVHAEARQTILDARKSTIEPGIDQMGGLQIGTKVIGEGKVGQEMGIGTVMGAGSTPGMVLVKMEESGREMALPARKLQALQDEKMIKAAAKIVKRVPNRAPVRRQTHS